MLPLPSTPFSAGHELFLPGGTGSNRAHRSRQILSRSLRGGAAAIRRACVTENTRPPEIYFIPALALDGRPSGRGAERRGSRDLVDFRNPVCHPTILRKSYGTRCDPCSIVHLAETARLLLFNELSLDPSLSPSLRFTVRVRIVVL